jgi:hypothetical protein
MLQNISSQSQILDNSHQLIASLRSQSPASPFIRNALVRHQALHTELEARQKQSEHALSAWREALHHRWKCEIDAQRSYSQILQQLRSSYGTNSPQLQAIEPASSQHAGAVTDLLNDLRRLHATLQLMRPSLNGSMPDLLHLEGCCKKLEAALYETEQLEKQRRAATIARNLAEEACQRAIDETVRLLTQHRKVAVSLTVSAHSENVPAYADQG